MKYVKGLAVIVAVCFAGEAVKSLLPLPVPGSIYGLVIMFILLVCGVVKLESVEKTADFLIDAMPVMFIPAGAAVMFAWDTLKSMLPAAVCSVLIITPFVMAVTGLVAQFLMRKEKKQ